MAGHRATVSLGDRGRSRRPADQLLDVRANADARAVRRSSISRRRSGSIRWLVETAPDQPEAADRAANCDERRMDGRRLPSVPRKQETAAAGRPPPGGRRGTEAARDRLPAGVRRRVRRRRPDAPARPSGASAKSRNTKERDCTNCHETTSWEWTAASPATTAVIGDETGPHSRARARPDRATTRRRPRAGRSSNAPSAGVSARPARQAGLELATVTFEAACFGLSGGPEDRLEILGAIVQSPRPLIVTNDAVVALAGATPEGQGIIVIAGTGSISFGRNADGRDGARGRMGLHLRR